MPENVRTNLHVYEAIALVTEEMSKDGISKDRKNQQQGYQFRGIDDVYNALSPVLAKNKLCIMPRMIERELVERATQKGGVLFYVTVKAEFDFVSAIDGSTHTVVTYGEAMDSADKATNKAMSAAYKYAAFQTFCIPTEGDNDADASTHAVKAKGNTTAENRESVADLWPVDQQEVWYKAAETLFSGEPSVKTLFAWEASDGNGKRFKAFHDESRAKTLFDGYSRALRIAAITDMENISGLNELDAYWTESNRLLKGRLKDLFDEVEQAKNTIKAKLNAGE